MHWTCGRTSGCAHTPYRVSGHMLSDAACSDSWPFRSLVLIRYLSVFSGIGSASFALGRLRRGFRAVAFAEVCPDASRVLSARFPGVRNVGSAENIIRARLGAVDLLIGGSPCQPFSMTGKRDGLRSPTGRLALLFWEIFWHLAEHNGCKAAVFENVRGMLSSTRPSDEAVNAGQADEEIADNFGPVLGMALGHPGWAVPEPAGGWPPCGRVRGSRAVAAWRVIHAADLGASQARPRLYLVVARVEAGIDPGRLLAIAEAEGHDTAEGGREVDPSRGGGGDRPRRTQVEYTGWNGDETPKVMAAAVPTLRAAQGGGGTGIAYRDHDGRAVIRRLTIREREELSGMPPGWTAAAGVSAAARVRMTGNTMYAPVVAMIGTLLANAADGNLVWKRARGRPRYHTENTASTGAERKAIWRAGDDSRREQSREKL